MSRFFRFFRGDSSNRSQITVEDNDDSIVISVDKNKGEAKSAVDKRVMPEESDSAIDSSGDTHISSSIIESQYDNVESVMNMRQATASSASGSKSVVNTKDVKSTGGSKSVVNTKDVKSNKSISRDVKKDMRSKSTPTMRQATASSASSNKSTLREATVSNVKNASIGKPTLREATVKSTDAHNEATTQSSNALRTQKESDETNTITSFSHDAFTLLDIQSKSDAGEYAHDSGIQDIKDDIQRCVKYCINTDTYCLKTVEQGHIVPQIRENFEAKEYLQKYNLRYRKDGDTSDRTATLYNFIHKYCSKGVAYNDFVFVAPPPSTSTSTSTFGIFHGWKYPTIQSDVELDNAPFDTFNEFLHTCAFRTDEECEHFLNWSANILQHPERHNRFGYIFTGKQGTGKTTLTLFLAKLTSGYCLENVEHIEDLFGEYNELRENKVLVLIQDFADGHNALLKLKPAITEDRFICHKKRSNKKIVENVNNFIIAANSGCFDLEQDDRRWQRTRFSNAHRNDTEYFEVLRNALEDDYFMTQLFNHLLRRDLSHYSNQILPTASTVKSDYERFVDWYISEHDDANFTPDDIKLWEDKHTIPINIVSKLCQKNVLDTGEPLRVLYTRFKQWLVNENGYRESQIPSELSFKSAIGPFTDTRKDSVLRISGLKYNVIHINYDN